jgi:hypothetical protein
MEPWDDKKDYSEDGGSGWGMLTPDPWEWEAIGRWVRAVVRHARGWKVRGQES